MAPKSKLMKSEWQECHHCGLVISVRDVRLHAVQTCKRLSAEDARYCATALSLYTFLNHGFILNGNLYAVVKEFVIRDDDKFPVSSHLDLAVLHPSAMKLCRMCIGSLVLITTTRGNQIICSSWPSTSIHPTTLSIRADIFEKYEEGRLVNVQAYTGSIMMAASITLQCITDKDIVNSENFSKCIKSQIGGHYLTTGMKLLCNYFGQPCELIVDEIVGVEEIVLENGLNRNKHDLHKEQISHSEITYINTSLAALDLDQSSECEAISMSFTSSKKTPITSNSFKPLQNESVIHSTPVKSDCESDFDISELYSSFRGSGEFEKDCILLKVYLITYETIIHMKGTEHNADIAFGRKVKYEDIGGLSKQIQLIKEIVDLPLKNHETFKLLGIHPPKGILLFGPPGTGKTLIASAVANESGLCFITINGPEVYSKYFGETESRLKNIFNEAKQKAPSIIFIDEIDSLCPKRDGASTEQEKRVIATLLTLLDDLPVDLKKRVLVLAATSKPDSLDISLRRPGRLDREIEIGIPNAAERSEILTNLLKGTKHNLTREDIVKIADKAHGFTGADLAAVCREAGLHAMKLYFKQNTCGLEDPEIAEKVKLTLSDVACALKGIKPSALKEISLEVPKVQWNDIGGMYTVKQKLKQAVEWPLKHPESFERLGISPPCGLLMYGPPGCSKTMVAKALATESGLNFLAVKGPELFSKWVGESEGAVRELFRKARAASPSIIFFDEIDALASERGSSSGGSNVAERVLAQLLTEMDGIEQLKGVIIVAATNRPDMIDKALLRPGRLDSIVYVPLPDSKTRQEIFRLQLKKIPADKDICVDDLVDKTEWYSGAEIVALCHEAALNALEEDLSSEVVRWKHFEHALKTVRPRTSKEMIKFYEDYYTKNKV